MPLSFPVTYLGGWKKLTPLPYQFQPLPRVELVGEGVEGKVLAQRSKSHWWWFLALTSKVKQESWGWGERGTGVLWGAVREGGSSVLGDEATWLLHTPLPPPFTLQMLLVITIIPGLSQPHPSNPVKTVSEGVIEVPGWKCSSLLEIPPGTLWLAWSLRLYRCHRQDLGGWNHFLLDLLRVTLVSDSSQNLHHFLLDI